MKKLTSILILLLCCTSATFAQYVVEGHVLDVNSVPVVNQTVWMNGDSINNPGGGFWDQTTTDVNGYYSMPIPGTAPSGCDVHVYTVCSAGSITTHNYFFSGSSSITSDFLGCTGITPPPPPLYVSGMVSDGNNPTGPGVEDALVYVIKKEYDSINSDYILTLLDSAYTDSTGWFYANWPSGLGFFDEVLVKGVMLPASPLYASLLPTYSSSSLLWSGATAASPNAPANIMMVPGSNPGGPGFIGGSVLQGANKTTGPGDPLAKRLMLLTDNSNNGIAYQYSDAQGEFSFSNLAYGTYKLFGDVWGKTSTPLIVTISASNPNADDIVFEENSASFEGHFSTSVHQVSANLKSLKLYPNPVMDQFTVTGLDKISGDKELSIYTISGMKVYQKNFTDKKQVVVPSAQLPAGTYMLHISTSEGRISYKMVK